MPMIQHYPSFILAVLIFQMIPGAGTITILSTTARKGRRAGMAAVAGTLMGDLIYMLAALAGLATVMRNHLGLFLLLQYAGALYLIWMGLQLLRTDHASLHAADRPPGGTGRDFLRAFVVATTNPKVILFFVSFFPLFLRPDGSAFSLVLLALHVSLLSLLYQGCLVLTGAVIVRHLAHRPRLRRTVGWLAGLCLVGFGVHLGADLGWSLK